MENVTQAMTYQTPTAMQQARYNAIRDGALKFAKIVLGNVDECADQQAALRCIREARMWANAAVAHNFKF